MTKCTKKFQYPTKDGSARIYFAGDRIEDKEAAAWAVKAGYGEETKGAALSKSSGKKAVAASTENKADSAAPENKAAS